MYTPFFFAGHMLAKIRGEQLDGYSASYASAIKYGCIIYGLLGLLFLSFILLRYYTDKVAALTLLLVFFASNLMVYIVKESERVHSSLFFLISVFIWLSIKWHNKPSFLRSLGAGLILGLITIIRPTDLIIVIVFVLFGVNGIESLKAKSLFLVKHKYLLFIFLIGFILVILPQIIFWKNCTGDWFHYGYGDEKFFWTHPKTFKMLFSLRNGWFVYSPIMLFAFIGLFFVRKHFPEISSATLIFTFLNLYVLSSWWCWWYMGFGLRAVVQSYPIMALGLASLLTQFGNVRSKAIYSLSKYSLTIVFGFFIFLNFVQSIQYRDWLLSGDGLTKKMYRMSFCKISWSEDEKKVARKNFPRINIPAAVKGKR
jgi:hypothetical protein